MESQKKFFSGLPETALKVALHGNGKFSIKVDHFTRKNGVGSNIKFVSPIIDATSNNKNSGQFFFEKKDKRGEVCPEDKLFSIVLF